MEGLNLALDIASRESRHERSCKAARRAGTDDAYARVLPAATTKVLLCRVFQFGATGEETPLRASPYDSGHGKPGPIRDCTGLSSSPATAVDASTIDVVSPGVGTRSRRIKANTLAVARLVYGLAGQ
jgi:hypothetical protein